MSAPGPPVTLDSVLGRAFTLWRHFLPAYLLVGLVVCAPVLTITGVVLVAGLGPAAVALAGLGLAVAVQLAAAIVMSAVFEQLRGRVPLASRLFARAVSRLLPALVTSLATSLATQSGVVIAAALVKIVPVAGAVALPLAAAFGIVLTARLAAAVPASILEDLPPLTAIRRSWSLTSRHKGTMLVLVLLLAVLHGALTLLVRGHPVLAVLVTIVLVSWHAVVIATAYHDLRLADA